MKPMTALITAAVFSVLSLNACGGSEKSMSIQEQTEARFQLNPHPKQAYRLRIKINDAPGPLKLMGKFGIGYKAENCSYVINHIEGATANPEKDVEIPVRQLGEFEYETVIYVDAVMDEDYFGEGVCHWKPQGFGVAFKATGNIEETKFNFGNFLDTLMERKTLTKYYWKGSYPYSRNEDGSIFIRSDGVGFTDWGDPLDKIPVERRKDLFSITLTLEEI